MLLKCNDCGNTCRFGVFVTRIMDMDIKNGQMKINFVKDCLDGHPVFCKKCGNRDVLPTVDFDRDFWARYRKLLQKE